MATMYDPPHPGTILADSVKALGLSAREFARHLAVAPSSVTRVLNGKGPITADMAVRIAAVMPGPRAGTWLAMQAEYDAWQAERTVDLSQVVPIDLTKNRGIPRS